MDRETYKKLVAHIKGQLKDHVDQKVALTRHRCEYKVSSRETTPEDKRQAWFHSIDDKRRELKNDIRHLHLTYGYIRGQDIVKMERKSKKPVDTGEIMAWLETYIIDVLKVESEIDKRNINGWLNGDPSPFARPRPAQVETAEVAA